MFLSTFYAQKIKKCKLNKTVYWGEKSKEQLQYKQINIFNNVSNVLLI